MTAAAMAISVVSQTALARTFGAAGLGEYQATSLFVIVLATALTLGLPLAVAQRVASLEDEGTSQRERVVASAAALTLPLAIVAGLVGFVVWPTIAVRLGLNAGVPAAVVASAVFASVLHSLVVSLLIARLRMQRATAVVVLQPVAVFAAVLLMPEADTSWLAAAGFIAAGIAAAVVLVTMRPAAAPRLSELRNLAGRSFSAASVLHVTLLAQWSERAVVAILAGPLALGAFAGASIAADAVQRLPRSLGGFGVAAYARLETDPASVSRVLGSHIRILSAVYIVAGAALITAGPRLLTLAFGPDFALARTTVRLLAIALVPNGIALAFASAAAGTNARGTGRIAIAIAVLHITTAIAGTAVFSIAGTAFAQVVVWSLAILLYRSAVSVERRDLDRSLARVTAIAVPVWTAAWLLGVSAVPVPFATVFVSLSAAGLSALLLLRSPDRRILRLVVLRKAHQDDSASTNRGAHARSE